MCKSNREEGRKGSSSTRASRKGRNTEREGCGKVVSDGEKSRGGERVCGTKKERNRTGGKKRQKGSEVRSSKQDG